MTNNQLQIISDNILNISSVLNDILDPSREKVVTWFVKNYDGTVKEITIDNLAKNVNKITTTLNEKFTDTKTKFQKDIEELIETKKSEIEEIEKEAKNSFKKLEEDGADTIKNIAKDYEENVKSGFESFKGFVFDKIHDHVNAVELFISEQRAFNSDLRKFVDDVKRDIENKHKEAVEELNVKYKQFTRLVEDNYKDFTDEMTEDFNDFKNEVKDIYKKFQDFTFTEINDTKNLFTLFKSEQEGFNTEIKNNIKNEVNKINDEISSYVKIFKDEIKKAMELMYQNLDIVFDKIAGQALEINLLKHKK